MSYALAKDAVIEMNHDQCQMSVELRAKMEALAKDYERRNAETLMLWQTCDQLGRDMVEVKTMMKVQTESLTKLANSVEKHVEDSVGRIKQIEKLEQFKNGATFGIGILFTATIGFLCDVMSRRIHG